LIFFRTVLRDEDDDYKKYLVSDNKIFSVDSDEKVEKGKDHEY